MGILVSITVAPPPIAVQPHRSEHTICLTWVKAVADAQKSHELDIKVINKVVQHDACTTQQELKAQVNTDADSQPHKPGGEQEVVHLVYMAAHGPNTPLSYRDAAQGVPKESQGTPYIILIKRGLF